MITDPLILLLDVLINIACVAFFGWFWFGREPPKKKKSSKEVKKNADDIRGDDSTGNTKCDN